ncbi:nuclear protein Es2-domain-containing protein [Phakopsora pachyrhizi]|uniref:Nuclear protein Es2-domain-containing protein n=1 Tax=Phakopsora pachyrhizi TaxID=170000 RepID=A0AAV0APY1_PHAPC|nr:nuclear protein Es2-domain-containing protein [Phakopsora pachyrhizi]CAH7669903.1 nuclear protein Es2-domain-containing protein [Phakopsora pachyrhizi]
MKTPEPGSSVSQPTKGELIKLKPPSTPIALDGDPRRGLRPVTYHSVHGRLQSAPTISLKNQKVLEEDDYMEGLSNIIKRDFFPCLDEFEREKKKWLDERQRRIRSGQITTNDNTKVSTIETDFGHHNLDKFKWSDNTPSGSYSKGWEDGGPTPIPAQATPGRTPLGFKSGLDTPASMKSNDSRLLNPILTSSMNSKTKKKSYDESLSLDEFCSRYTSEDNSSFSEILNNANRIKRMKYSWAFDSSSKHNNKLLESTLKREHLISLIGKMTEGGKGVGIIEGISGKPGERKMVENVLTREERLAIEASSNDVPKLITQSDEILKPLRASSSDGVKSTNLKGKSVSVLDDLTDPESQPIKNPESWHHETRNALMFAPDANSSTNQLAKPPPFPASSPVILGDPKSINYSSTRMVSDDVFADTLRKSKSMSQMSTTTASPTRSQIKAAITGTPYPAGESSSPKVNGFSYVPEMATPNPDRLNESSELDRLMTWGEIISTPLRVDGMNDECSFGEDQRTIREEEFVQEGPFRIPKTPRREELAMGMARQASKSLRKKFGTSIGGGGGGSGGIGVGSRQQLRYSLLRNQSNGVGDLKEGRKRSISDSKKSSGGMTPSREDMLSPAARLLLKKTSKIPNNKN